MRTTLDLPKGLINEAMGVARVRTKTALIKIALENLIQREKIKAITNYFGKINLNLDLDKMRQR